MGTGSSREVAAQSAVVTTYSPPEATMRSPTWMPVSGIIPAPRLARTVPPPGFVYPPDVPSRIC